MRSFSFLLISVLVAAALAGCTGGDDTTSTPTPDVTEPPLVTPTTTTPPVTTPIVTPTTQPVLDSSTYSLTSVGIPTMAKPGAKFNFTLFVNGSVARNSDHLGAHFADNDTTDPPVSPGRKDCEHDTDADLPGVFVVNCTINDIGTWYVWGHARINDSGELRNWWPTTPAIVKVRDYNATLSGVPTNIQTSGANFSVTLTLAAIGASENVTSNHIGVHYWNATEQNPSRANAAGACEHAAGGAVGTYTIACNIVNSGVTPKEHYLRGHLLLEDATTSLSWWSQEYAVNIAPHIGLPVA